MQQVEPSPPPERAESIQRLLQEQLDEGIRTIQRTAGSLMHEIAAEVWRTAGGDKGEVQARVLEELSRDQAIRGLIAHSDERFQALAVRTSRLEDTLTALSDSLRAATDQLAQGIALLRDAGAPDKAELGARIDEVVKQVTLAFRTLADRDQAVVDAVRARVREHGDLITQETSRIAAAMESYVQHGVEAVGQLAGSMEQQVRVMATRDQQVHERVKETISEQMGMLGEQLQLLFERMAIDTSSLNEGLADLANRNDGRLTELTGYVEFLNERSGLDSREIREAVREHAMGLARLVRSDSEALRRELVRTAAEHDEAVARIMDERLGRVSSALTDATRWMVEELTRRTNDALRTGFEAMGQTVAENAARATEVAIGERLDHAEARMQAAAGEMERTAAELGGSNRRVEEVVGQTLDGKIAALAKLIRSDNRSIAQQISADQEASKQALRAMKELQASLPNEVIEMVEQRFGSLAESIERSNELLATRIDRMAQKIGERYDNDIQVVIDRMGDAMHALASLGRAGAQTPADPRIDLG